MGKHIDFEALNNTESIADTRWAASAAGAAVALFRASPGFELTIENLEGLPDRPVIVAMNHTHFYDFLPLRAPTFFMNRTFVSWVKARAYKDPRVGLFLSKTGNVPICSRGYIIASDFYELFERRPTEDEYRVLREHVDHGSPLPDEELYERIQETSRNMLGWAFNPTAQSYRQAVRAVFYELMQISLRKTRRAVNRGDHVHVYPQGSIAQRLIPGKVGIVHAALALGLPILPVGVAGCRDGFHGKTPLPVPGQKMSVRFGDELYTVPRDEFPDDFRPYHPDDEQRVRAQLEYHTQLIMERINELLPPDHQWAPDMQSDAKRGVARFF